MNKGVLLSKDLAMRTKVHVERGRESKIPKVDPSELAGLAGLILPIELTENWENDDNLGWVARFRKLYFEPAVNEYEFSDHDEAEDDVYYPLSAGSKPPGEKGSRAFAVYRGNWEIIAFGEFGASDAKELFPAVAYRRHVGSKRNDGTIEIVPETFVICPGGRDENRSIKTVHVLHVEKKKVSTSTFGNLPMAMCNFGASLTENNEGCPVLVCAPGEIESGSRYPVQRFDFVQDEWSKSDTTQSLAGCPAYVVDGKVIVAGGQSAYYVSSPIKTAGSTQTQFYGHTTTPFWEIDAVAGTLETRTPRRIIVSGTSEQPESYTVNQQKRFLKQNFSGVFLGKSGNLPVEFLAVGGSELLGYQSRAVVSYAINSTGPVLDCEHADIRIGGDCEIFPDTPIPFGECRAVRIRRWKDEDVDLLVCVGGRYKTEVDTEIVMPDGSKKTVKKTVFEYHEKPWSLNLENTSEGWRNDLFERVPTPRYNAGLSDVVTTKEEIINEATGEPTGQKREVDRVFLIGGRNADGLLTSIEALNLTTGEWETEWPGLDGRIPEGD